MSSARTYAGPPREVLPESWVRRHLILLLALLVAVLFHGGLQMAGSYARTYDAYVHIFLGDHYARDWFSTWDDRWYTGFTTVSYPPGTHQAIAALSNLIGLRAAFVVVITLAILNGTIGCYRTAHIWVGHRAAGYAALAYALCTSVGETAHLFGQLPTLYAIGFLQQSLPFAYRWVRTGRLPTFVLGVACTAACTAGHHVTTLMGSVFFLGPVLVVALVDEMRSTPADEVGTGWGGRTALPLSASVRRRVRRGVRPAFRACVYGVTVGISLLVVVLPYWLYSAKDPILQVSIPHSSRDSFLENTSAGLVFWLVPWGTTLVALPYAFIRGYAGRTWPLAMSLTLAAFLGTGGTTPYPKMLLGGAFDVLTLDRFTFWATILVLPLVGQFIESLTTGSLRQFLVGHLGRAVSTGLAMGLAMFHVAALLLVVNLSHYRPFQPPAIDTVPLVSFINKDEHYRWRYITLGFGDQMAWVGANTTATTVDGNYHSARRLPELTSRPVERLEGAKFSGVPGIGSLQQFLATPERYSLKYAFSADHFYDPLLDAYGWIDLGPLENGIQVWERPDVPPVVLPAAKQAPLWQRAMWGVLPPTAIVGALSLLLWRAVGEPAPRFARRFVARLHRVSDRFLFRRWASWAEEKLRIRLVQAAAALPDAGWEPSRHAATDFVVAFRDRARRGMSQIPSRQRRVAATLVVVTALSLLGATAREAMRTPPPGPADVVYTFYDAMDFRRFEEAYASLDPGTRPSFMAWRREIGADGGLIASFAKLDSLHTEVLRQTEDLAVVKTRASYLTAVGYYDATQNWEVVRSPSGGWGLKVPTPDPAQPTEQFTSRNVVRYIQQQRRGVIEAADTTSLQDVMDRPQLELGTLRAWLVRGQWVIVGEVSNVDVDPAAVTVHADLRDAEGNLIGSWNASDVIQHALLPGERTAFRIDMQSIAGVAAPVQLGRGAALHVKETGDRPFQQGLTPVPNIDQAKEAPLNGPVEFDPTTITPLNIPADAPVASVSVYARAVVSTRNQVRGLQVLDARVRTDPDTNRTMFSARIRNDSPNEVALPHLLLTYRDKDLSPAWVDHAYLAHSISPQREVTIDVPLGTAEGLVDPKVPIEGYDDHTPTLGQSPGAMLDMPPASGFATVEAQIFGYVRGSTS